MPNWCYTTYKCIGEPKEIKELYDALKYIDERKTSIIPNDFGKFWLGNLVTRLGGNWEDYPCRGDIIDYYLKDKETLFIYQNTAWCEQRGVRRCIEDKLPSIKVYYQAEEAGCGVYITNSFEQFPDKYYLDTIGEPMYFENLDEAARHVSSIVGHEVKPDVTEIQNALDDYEEKQDDDDCYFCFNSFEEIND